MFELATSVFGGAILALYFNNKRFVSNLLLFAFVAYSSYFSYLYFNNEDVIKSVEWFANLQISVFLKAKSFLVILPSIIVAIAVNVFNRQQKQQDYSIKNAIVIANAVLLFFIFGSTNIIQMLITIILIDILTVFALSNDVENKNKFIYYTFVANALLFFVVAALLSIGDNLNISSLSVLDIPLFLKGLFCIAIAIKTGFWGVNGYILKFKNTNEALSFLYTSSPITGFLVAYKLPFLLGGTFNLLALISAFIYLLFFIKEADLKSKFISFSLASLCFSLYLNNPFIYLWSLPLIIVMSLIIILASFETNVLLMGGFIKKNKSLYIISLFAILLYINNMLGLEQNLYTISFEFLSLLGISILFRSVFFSAFRGFDEVFDNIKSPNFINYIPLIALLPFLYVGFSLFSLAFFGLFIITQFISFDKAVNQKKINDVKVFYIVENIAGAPLKAIGRVLWLVVDFLLIQKTIIYSSYSINQKVFEQYKKIENKQFLWIALGLFIIAIVIGVSNYD
ncbi:MAG: hypothetical protein R3Y43_08020 [Alphaproteobacteria bacterium]